jgi:hypothetical protein
MLPSAEGAIPRRPAPPTKRQLSHDPLGCILCNHPSLVAVYSVPPAAAST